MSDDWKADAQRTAQGIRRRVLASTVRRKGGYLTQACCSAEALAVLYHRVMNLGPSVGPRQPAGFPGVPGPEASVTGAAYNGPPDPAKDRFLLSPTHYAIALYATLIEVDRLDDTALEQFNTDGSNLEMIGSEHSPGVEATTGSLAQALSVAIGQTLARRLRGDTGRNWVYMSDGELEEGETWEAFQTAAHFRLASLGVYLDANGFQVDGPVERVMELEPIVEKIAAFGWDVHEVDGHDLEALAEAAENRSETKPLMVVCRTRPWEGIPSLKDRYPSLHYVRFKDDDEIARALADLDMNMDEVTR